MLRGGRPKRKNQNVHARQRKEKKQPQEWMEERTSNELAKEGKQSSRKWKSRVVNVAMFSVLERTAIGSIASLHNM